MQERRPRKSFREYEVPALVTQKLSELVDMLDDEGDGACSFVDIRTLVTGNVARCNALEQDICYAMQATKRYERVEDFRDCPVYKFVEAARARRNAPPPPRRPTYF
jgi:hypothetical protein